ncbi:hypothetical protein [Methylobacterium terrae]|uniref:hypothetical protein n=1 Tax=Methylobacterium terrae TaxID=2202827 RepID=UPI003CC9AAF3
MPRITRHRNERHEKLGRRRRVVERGHAWFNRFRRLPIRYEQRGDIYQAFISFAASLITPTRSGGSIRACLIRSAPSSYPPPHPEVSVDRRSSDLEGGLQQSLLYLRLSFEAPFGRTSG